MCVCAFYIPRRCFSRSLDIASVFSIPSLSLSRSQHSLYVCVCLFECLYMCVIVRLCMCVDWRIRRAACETEIIWKRSMRATFFVSFFFFLSFMCIMHHLSIYLSSAMHFLFGFFRVCVICMWVGGCRLSIRASIWRCDDDGPGGHVPIALRKMREVLQRFCALCRYAA